MINAKNILAVVRHLCKRVAVMPHGRLVEIGTTDQILTAPRGLYPGAAELFREVDVLLTPTCTVPPLPLDAHDIDAPRATVKDLFDHLAPIETFTALFNATGQPAMSLPLCWSKSGLPLGMQLVGRGGDEATLFRVAAALEQALPWHERRPPIHVAA